MRDREHDGEPEEEIERKIERKKGRGQKKKRTKEEEMERERHREEPSSTPNTNNFLHAEKPPRAVNTCTGHSPNPPASGHKHGPPAVSISPPHATPRRGRGGAEAADAIRC